LEEALEYHSAQQMALRCRITLRIRGIGNVRFGDLRVFPVEEQQWDGSKMTPAFPYVKLPGSYHGFFRQASLWEGADHILLVSGSRFSEEYRRFYYRDIQALLVEKRPRAGSPGWWIILSILLIIATISTGQNDPPYSWVGLAVLSLILLIRLDLTFRRSCRCSIQTAVSREVLPSLIRRRDAENAINRLHTRIIAEQGELPDEIPFSESEEDVASLVVPPAPDSPSASQVLAEAAALERRRLAARGINLAILTCFLLLLNSVFTLWFSSEPRPVLGRWPLWFGYLFIAAELVSVFLSLQSLTGLKALKGLRAFLITIIVLCVLRTLMGLTLTQTQMVLARAYSAYFGAMFNRYYVNTNAGIQFALAAVGLILIFTTWDSYRRGEISAH
jgi:hypothetical protein